MIAVRVNCSVCNHVYALFEGEKVICICGNEVVRS